MSNISQFPANFIQIYPLVTTCSFKSQYTTAEEKFQKGTCGMMDIFWRRVCRPISVVWKPSIIILPSGSASRNKAEIRELLPAPVRPTMPTYSGEMRTIFISTRRKKNNPQIHKKRQNIIMLLQAINHTLIVSCHWGNISLTTMEPHLRDWWKTFVSTTSRYNKSLCLAV